MLLKHNLDGQMTVEYALVFPVMLLLSAVMLYAFLYMVASAHVDGIVHDAIRIETSVVQPRDEVIDGIYKRIEGQLREYSLFDAAYVDVHVCVERSAVGHWVIDVDVHMPPGCFHMPLAKVGTFQVPGLTHTVHMVVSPYRSAVVM